MQRQQNSCVRRAYVLLAGIAASALVACGGSDTPGAPAGSPSAPPSSPPPPPVATVPIVSFFVGVPGVYDAFDTTCCLDPGVTVTVSPPLPAGLTVGLNFRTVIIQGTPTALSPAQQYTLTAASGEDSMPLTVSLAVAPVLFYPSPAILDLGAAMTPLVPTGTTGQSTFSVAPTLPAGLSLDSKTGIISGTPIQPSSPGYYLVTSNDATFRRQYGLTLAVTDPSAATGVPSKAPFNCVHSGGFIGTFTADPADASYGLIAVAFTPDGHAKARVDDLVTGELHDSDGLQALSSAMDGTFAIGFADVSDLSVRGSFSGPDLISGTYQHGATVKSFTATRLGGLPTAQYRYSGGFDYINGYRVDFGTVDVTGPALNGLGYQMLYPGSDSLLINRQLSFASTISDGVFTVTVDSVTSTWTYTAGQSSLQLGDPYDSLFYIATLGCQLN